MNYFNCHTHKSKKRDWEIIAVAPEETPTSFHSVGIHPWKAHLLKTENLQDKLLNRITPKTLAIGEIGLDAMKGPRLELQIDVFIDQVEASETAKLPVLIHCVKAWSELSMIKRKLEPTQIWVYHGFAKANLLDEVLREKMIVSIGADILTNLKLQKVISKIPNDRLLLETDDKDVTIQEIYEKVAELKGITLVLLGDIIEKNFKRIFPKWQIG
jgi:TatD DNase family protein